jgi:hypothetical protein
MTDLSTLLSSIITASSILIAVGFPFIIFIVTNHDNRRDKLLVEIKAYYPKLHAFRQLVYLIYTTGVIKNFDRKLRQAKSELEKEEIRKDGGYSLYKAFTYIANKYTLDVENDNDMYRTISHKEMMYYHQYTRDIYTYIINRHDTEFNLDRLNDITPHFKKQIIQAITDISTKYSTSNLTIENIGMIANDIDEKVTNVLESLTRNYERPLPMIAKYMFFVLTASLIFGVILPLLLLQFPILQICYISITLTVITVSCLTLVVIITGQYVWKKK